MKEIQLTQGKITLVDDEDFEWLNRFKWHIGSGGYAFKDSGKTRMHRFITNCPADMEVDHINRNRLDNRKENLRICGRRDNNLNRGLFKTNTSGFRGVSFHKPLMMWRAKITINNKHFHLGYFKTPEEASKEYEMAKAHSSPKPLYKV